MRLLAISVPILLTTLLAQQTAPDPGAFELGPTQGTGVAKQGPRPKAGPAPHLANGLPDFGGNGAWYPGFGGNIAEMRWKGVKSADVKVDVPFLPAALELFNQRVTSNSKDDPEAQCLPVGVPRYMFDPYAFEMVQTPKQVVFLFEGDNYLWRTVPLRAGVEHPKDVKPTLEHPKDVKPTLEHPKDVKPTWMGDAVGHYDRDNLIVDVVGFNGKAWLDQAGHPQTAQAHLTERYTRTDSLTLKYEVTIDDPGAYSKPWTASNTVSYRPGFQLMEFICQENEKDSAHMTKERL